MKRLAILLGLLLLVGCVSATTSLYVSVYPPAHTSTYVKATSELYITDSPWFATDPTKPLTGAVANNVWISEANGVNQRFHIDYGSTTQIDRIYYENYAYIGTYTTWGARNFTFWGSNTSGSFNNLTYGNDTGWTQIGVSQQYFDEHIASDIADPKYITLNSSQRYRYYAFKFADGYVPSGITYIAVRRIELQKAISWEYTTPGTYTWTCPMNITNITVQFVGGGSSGTPSNLGLPSHGGTAGNTQTVPIIAVVPGTNYSIVVGAGGARANIGSTRNNGALSSGFGYTIVGGSSTSSSIDGNNGYFSVTQFAEDGGGGTGIYPPGSGGIGYGAGGGAGGYDFGYFYGGKGADGYILISNSSLFTGNTPDFSASTTTDFAGTQIAFRDLSTIVNSTSLTYLWDFGDGTTSTTAGDVNHVYSYTGSYTVSLTLNNSAPSSAVTETKNEYINIVSKPSTFATPRTVTFIFTDYYNNPLPGLTVAVTPLDATIPESWFTQYYGIGSGVTLTSTGFTGTTGDDGSWAIPMSEDIRYQFLMTNVTAGISATRTFYPTDLKYIIKVPTASTIAGNNTLSQMGNTSLPVYQINTTAYNLSVIYHDTSGLTTDVLFTVKWRNGTVIYNNDLGNPGTGVVAGNYTIINPGIGKEVIWMYNATRSGI